MGKQDHDCVHFLQWALPMMGMRWEGFRKVRRQVCHRILERARKLGIGSLAGYRSLLEEQHPEEWDRLRSLCRVTISRFYRDRAVFNALRWEVLPVLATRTVRKGRQKLRVWSIGCASGEEAYTVLIIWKELWESESRLEIEIVGTDIDPAVLRRAREGSYPASSLRELPNVWRETYFGQRDDEYVISPELRKAVQFFRQDLLEKIQFERRFDLMLCRYLLFTYFQKNIQRSVLEKLSDRLHPGGVLVLGATEKLPDTTHFKAWFDNFPIYRKLLT